VEEAARAGLAGVGIADHDTVEGVNPALAAGDRLGVVVVPGVEINTDYKRDEVHILGYYIDSGSSGLNLELERLRGERLERGRRIVARLNQLGVKVSLDQVCEIAGHGSVGRPHIARAIVEAGFAHTINEAFGKYLVRGASAYVERHKLTPFQAIEIVHQAGGVAVLAHPGNSRHDELILPLVDAGIQGIEAFHTDHSSAQSERYVETARRYNLIVTGGSDSHGPNMLKTVAIGHVVVDMEVVRQLRELARAEK
jgi:predicted metal-dependent phosphoesterase TrpH